MGRFLIRAQNQNMTNGDFAFFTWQPVRVKLLTYQPWTLLFEDPVDVPRRRQAFYAVKQVRASPFPPLLPSVIVT